MTKLPKLGIFKVPEPRGTVDRTESCNWRRCTESQPRMSHPARRALSSLTKVSKFPDLVRRELASRSRSRQFNSAMPPPHLMWDEFLTTSPTPSLTAMRNKASELFGGPEEVIEILEREEIETIPFDAPDRRLIRMGISASYRRDTF